MGVLNLTIDNAPTIPKDKAIFVDIIDVITYPVTGRRTKFKNWV